jgi:AcrR family transcriptional regulator
MPQRRQPVQKRSHDTVERLTNTARELFSTRGLYSVSSHDIAREAGVSVGTFYLYFPDKNDLFVQLLQQRLDEFKSVKLELGIDRLNTLEARLRRLWKPLIAWAKSWDRFFLDVSALYYADPLVRPAIDRVEDGFALELAEFFKPWIEQLSMDERRAKLVFIYNLIEATVRTILLSDKDMETILGTELISCLEAYLGGE